MSIPPPPPQHSAELMRLFDRLDVMDYYELLGADEKADYLQLRQAHAKTKDRLSAERFEGDKHERTRICAGTVAARLDEALGIVGDPWLRPRYDQARARGQNRANKELRELRQDPAGSQHPFTRVYLEVTKAKIQQGQAELAIRDMMLALSCEEEPSDEVEETHQALMAALHAADMPKSA